MAVRLSALLAAVAVVAGCNHGYARKDSTRTPPPRDPLAQSPAGRDPLPIPSTGSVTPPSSDVLADLPPMPGEVTPAGAVGELASLDAGDRREKRKERREDRKDRRNPTEPVQPPPPKAPDLPPLPSAAPAPAGDARPLVEAAVKRYAEVPDFEARLVKQEVVSGKQMPRDELAYRFRQQPLSVYMKVLSDAGQGREVLYVQGKFGNQMHVVTGKGDNNLVGAGYKTSLALTDRKVTDKSRYRPDQAGFGRTLDPLPKQLAAGQVRALGAVKRAEYPYPLDGLEVTLRPGDDPLLPKGGKRELYFDSKKDSPSYLLPVVVVTTDADRREVEYYCFDRFRVPSGWTDADWTPDRIGKR